MSSINIFEQATRSKLRFASPKGELSVEQLWDVPLRSRGDGFDLNAVAKAANKAVEEGSEEFVETKRTPEHARRELTLQVVKYVIETKLADEVAAQKRAANREEKQKLLEILADKQTGRLTELSEKELRRRIAALGDI